MDVFVCNKCNMELPSRNKLFKHIRVCGQDADLSKRPRKSVSFAFEEEGSNSKNVDGNCIVYVLGGRLRGRTLSAVHTFSVETQQWSLSVPMRQNRGSHGAACVEGVVFSIGGGGLDCNLDACECFDGEEWRPIPALLTSRHALAVTSFGSNIYAVGGWVDGSKCSGAVEMFVPAAGETAGKWVALPPLRQPRRLHGLAALDHKLFVFGGCCDDPQWYTDSVEVLDLSGGTEHAAWTELPGKVPAAGELRAVAVEPYIFLFLNGRRVVRYDPSDDSHTPLSTLPLEDWHCFDAVHTGGGHVLVLGGACGGVWSSAVYDYDVKSDAWTSLPPMTQAKRRCACAVAFRPLSRAPPPPSCEGAAPLLTTES